MKKLIKPSCLILSVLLFILLGCNKEQPVSPITEIPINGTQKTIKVEQNGIGITFCLLNNQGQPATVFRQGKNFKFNLAIKNNIQKDTALYIVSSFLFNPDLFRVCDENGAIMGKPWLLKFCNYISDGVNELKRGNEWVMESSWKESDSTETHFLQCYFQGLDQPLLPPGKYYTTLKQQFCLGRYFNYEDYSYTPTDFICTDTLSFKINFEIK